MTVTHTDGEILATLAVLGACPAPPRLRVTCEAAVQLVPCCLDGCGAREGLDGCGAREGLACDGETGAHVVRLGAAMRRKIITGGQFIEALQSALIFTGATIIRPDGHREDADLAVLGIFYDAGKDAARRELGLPPVRAAGTPRPRHLRTVRVDR